MHRLAARLAAPRVATLLVLLAAAATIATALYSQHVLGYVPCKLCLIERWPYYVAVPLALALVLAPVPDGVRRAGLWLLALVFLVSAGLGAYHAGVEWGVWLGPNDCGGVPPPAPAGMDDFFKQLEGIRIVSCTEAPFHVRGLSMAGWNAVVSLALAAFAALAAAWGPRAS